MFATEKCFQKYGVWSLLMAWAPIGADALTFIAGVMRVNFCSVRCADSGGKGLRYAFLRGVMGFFGLRYASINR